MAWLREPPPTVPVLRLFGAIGPRAPLSPRLNLSGLAGAATDQGTGGGAGADQDPPAAAGAGDTGRLEDAPPASAPPKPPAPRRRGGDKPDKTA